jgi:hypothetical protein
MNVTRKLPVKKNVIFFFFFTKSENRRAEQVLSGGLVSVEGGGCGEREWYGEYSENIVYTCV